MRTLFTKFNSLLFICFILPLCYACNDDNDETNGHSPFSSSLGIKIAKFYRPPEGKFSRRDLEFAKELGYKTVFWSFAYADWDNGKQPSLEYAEKKILDNAHPGEIMLLHPTSATNAAVLDSVLTKLESEGYRFGSLNSIV